MEENVNMKKIMDKEPMKKVELSPEIKTKGASSLSENEVDQAVDHFTKEKRDA